MEVSENICNTVENISGISCIPYIREALSHPDIFFFSNLIGIKSISELKNLPETFREYNTLELFTYGSYLDYKNRPENYVSLTSAETQKLRILSIISLSETNKIISYKDIMSATGIDDMRPMEDLITEAIYKGLVLGKLNQRNQIFRVLRTTSRDVKRENLPILIEKFTSWRSLCGVVVEQIEDASRVLRDSRASQQEIQRDVQRVAEKLTADLKSGSLKVDQGSPGREEEESWDEAEIGHVRSATAHSERSLTSRSSKGTSRSAKRMKAVSSSLGHRDH